ncbi:MAG: HD domain-containing protein [Spirochaetales bacterium]|nr:HD domain-containing protein [Spirochaetales bacterium]
MNLSDSLQQKLEFLIEIDKLKSVFRKTRLFDCSREENDAEHAWHLALFALTLSDYANEPVDVAKVVKMVLAHDLVEVYAGDTFLYSDKPAEDKYQEEKAAGERLFSMLPELEGREWMELWEEFEAEETAESRFAAALDRLEPVMQNYLTKGFTWKKYGITRDRVIKANKKIARGSAELWDYALDLINKAVEKGYLNN